MPQQNPSRRPTIAQQFFNDRSLTVVTDVTKAGARPKLPRARTVPRDEFVPGDGRRALDGRRGLNWFATIISDFPTRSASGLKSSTLGGKP